MIFILPIVSGVEESIGTDLRWPVALPAARWCHRGGGGGRPGVYDGSLLFFILFFFTRFLCVCWLKLSLIDL